MSAVLEIEDLVVEVPGSDGPLRAVDGVSLSTDRGEVLGLVGESGSGKSLTMLAAIGLLPAGARIASGQVRLDGRPLIGLTEPELRPLRGRTAAMIFQDPMSALNPLRAVGAQVAAAVRVHTPMSRRAARSRAVELLASVGVSDAERRAGLRPHQWSGGMRQRAMIAMAIAHDPLLLIADEPTTALDVTVQAQVMDVLAEVRERTGSALVLITHDLGLVSESSDRVAVMYGGRIVETGATDAVFAAAQHPYTQGLLASIPDPDEGGAGAGLRAIPGLPPSPAQRPAGCAFHPRCPKAERAAGCFDRPPVSLSRTTGGSVSCHRPGPIVELGVPAVRIPERSTR
jgi:oligopeptide/dipeptide ABC transporter ATP-binding protein